MGPTTRTDDSESYMAKVKAEVDRGASLQPIMPRLCHVEKCNFAK